MSSSNSQQTREASFVLPSVVVEPLNTDGLYPAATPPEVTGNWLTRRFPYDQPTCDSARTSITRVNLPLVEEEEGMSASVAPSIRNPAEEAEEVIRLCKTMGGTLEAVGNVLEASISPESLKAK